MQWISTKLKEARGTGRGAEPAPGEGGVPQALCWPVPCRVSQPEPVPDAWPALRLRGSFVLVGPPRALGPERCAPAARPRLCCALFPSLDGEFQHSAPAGVVSVRLRVAAL